MGVRVNGPGPEEEVYSVATGVVAAIHRNDIAGAGSLCTAYFTADGDPIRLIFALGTIGASALTVVARSYGLAPEHIITELARREAARL